MNMNTHGIKTPTFEHIRGTFAGHVIYALHEVGMLNELEAGHSIDLTAINSRVPEPGEQIMISLCDYLSAIGVLEKQDEEYRLTSFGKQLIPEATGYYTWAIGGYEPVLRELPRMLIGASRYGENVSRYGRDVAIGSAEIGRYHVMPQVIGCISKRTFKKVIDLGCGSANLLIELCGVDPERTGVGVDNSLEAGQAARDNVRKAGLTDRIEIIHADAEKIANINHETIAGTDLVTALFLVHEMLKHGLDYTIDYLRGIAKVLGTSGAIGICEVTKLDEAKTTIDVPFVAEFQLLHDLTNQKLATRDKWGEIIEAAGFELKVCEPLGIPGGYFFLAVPR